MDNKSFADLITFTRSTTGTYLNSDGVLTTAAINEPRFEYDGAGQPRGLLFEQQRTNLALRSQEFDNAYWSKARTTVSPNSTIAPDGTSTADRLVEDNSNNTHLVQRSIAGTGSAVYVWTVFVKAAERTFASIRVDGVGAQVAFNAIDINLTTGQFTATDPSRTYVERYPNGWFKVSSRITIIPAGGNVFPSVYVATGLGVTSYLGDGTSGIYVWGGQFEAGDCPSSYIPTVAAAVTRAADLAFVPQAVWMKVGEGTVFAEVQHESIASLVGGDVATAVVGTTSTQGRITLWVVAPSRSSSHIVNNAGVTVFLSTLGPTLTQGLIFKQATAYKENDVQFSTFGLVSPLDTAVDLPTIDRIVLGARGVSSNHMQGHIRRIRYFPRRLTAAELQGLTA